MTLHCSSARAEPAELIDRPPVPIPKRARTSSSEVTDANAADPKGKSRPKTKKGRVEAKAKDLLLFPCPLYEERPDLWEDECGLWMGSAEGLIRHHVDKHMRLNQKFDEDDERRIDPKRFTKIVNWRLGIKLKRSDLEDHYQTLTSKLFDDEPWSQWRKFLKRFTECAANDEFIDKMERSTEEDDALCVEYHLAEAEIVEYFDQKRKKWEEWKKHYLEKLKDLYNKKKGKLRRRVTDELVTPGPSRRGDHDYSVQYTGSGIASIPAGYMPAINNGEHDPILEELPSLEGSGNYAWLEEEGGSGSFLEILGNPILPFGWPQGHGAQDSPRYALPQANHVFFPPNSHL